MNDSNGNNNNKKKVEQQRYNNFFMSMNDISETDEVLNQLVNLNFDEENNNSKIKSKEEAHKLSNNIDYQNISNINKEKKIIMNPSNNKDEKPLSIILLQQKINRICITMQGLNFKEKELNNIKEIIPYLYNVEENHYNYIDKLLDVYFLLLSRIEEEITLKEKFIQNLNDVSLGIEDYEKKNLMNQKKLKEKENEIISLVNQLNIEKEKNKDNSKSIVIELNSLKKENQELNDTILIYKNKLRKIEADYLVIQDKIKNMNVKEHKSKISSYIANCEEKNENGLNNSKTNDKYFLIKKLNMSLTYLLKEINKMLIKYDSSLITLINNKNSSQDKVIDLNCNIETNLLLDDANMKIFRKNFLYNMDRIFKKIEIIQKAQKYIKEISISSKINNKIKGAWKNNIINTDDKMNKSNMKGVNNSKSDDSTINTNNDNSGNNGIMNTSNEKHFKNNISSKWYDKYNNKKIGYVFDKEKVITCEDEDNGAK